MKTIRTQKFQGIARVVFSGLMLSAVLLSLVACGNYYRDKTNSGGSDPVGGSEKGQDIDFAMILAGPFNESKCTTCHSERGGNASGVNLETYGETKKWLREIRDEVASNSMPLRNPPMSEESKQVLFAWIEAGAPEFVTPPVVAPQPEPEPEEPPVVVNPVPPPQNYATVKALVLDSKCLQCHSTGSRTGVELDTYAGIQANLTEVREEVAADKMPPRTPLTADEKRILMDWIDAGAPET